MLLQGGKKLFVGSRRSVTPCHDDAVHRCKLLLVMPEALSHDTLDPVPVNGSTNLLLGDRESETRLTRIIDSHKDGEVAIR